MSRIVNGKTVLETHEFAALLNRKETREIDNPVLMVHWARLAAENAVEILCYVPFSGLYLLGTRRERHVLMPKTDLSGDARCLFSFDDQGFVPEQFPIPLLCGATEALYDAVKAYTIRRECAHPAVLYLEKEFSFGQPHEQGYEPAPLWVFVLGKLDNSSFVLYKEGKPWSRGHVIETQRVSTEHRRQAVCDVAQGIKPSYSDDGSFW